MQYKEKVHTAILEIERSLANLQVLGVRAKDNISLSSINMTQEYLVNALKQLKEIEE